ncbi:hypothetical protein HPC62_06505 [Thermoleptolyngbya sichuanensis A183]|uniref:Uncharacterized protein n=1 Tax=Thermoleptolyngbya sichuanensis A183 TaxID=2737172 RepID=A0A6M8BAR4_9CYAN|nr:MULTISPECIES: hypothetical protein [Thermoleptolyngbya]QKD81897.1 hypothetical protein HPC62_06505 [Thermoleptolyngbya sichuanensis A183]
MSSSRAQSSKSSGSSSSPNEPSQASSAPELSSPVPTDMDQISAPALSSDAPTVPSDLPTPNGADAHAHQPYASESLSEDDKTATVKPLTPPKPPKPPVRPAAAKPEEDPKPQSIKPSVAEPTATPDKLDSTVAESPATTEPVAEVGTQGNAEAASGTIDAGVAEKNTPRNHPIPPASEPMQYRAIGLVRGVYAPSEEQFTRGTLTTEDGTVIDAVLLGRVMSLVKKHLDLTQAHLWVVYPRTREKVADLHAQIVGVWEPESLTKPKEADEPKTGEASSESETVPESAMPDGLTDGYFSVRGEVLSASPEENRVVVRVQQAPKKTDKPGEDKERMFKIILHGTLEGKTVGYFWDLHVQRKGNDLMLQGGTLIGLVPPKKRKSKGGGPRSNFARKKRFPDRGGAPSRPVRAGEGGSTPAPVRREGISKPVKRQKDS